MGERRLAMMVSLVGLAAACGSNNNRPAPVVASAGCSADSECAGRGGVCVSGVCQQCRSGAECRGGACVDNRCVASPAPVAETSDTVAVRPAEGASACFEHVRFAFDDATLSEAARAALQRTADCIRRERGRRYVLLGHADARGTVEYNLALGHRRAQAVLNYLIALGVDRAQVAASSVGSEHATGTDEEGWARDRRVEHTDRGASTRR